jgi:hypothetical protein
MATQLMSRVVKAAGAAPGKPPAPHAGLVSWLTSLLEHAIWKGNCPVSTAVLHQLMLALAQDASQLSTTYSEALDKAVLWEHLDIVTSVLDLCQHRLSPEAYMKLQYRALGKVMLEQQLEILAAVLQRGVDPNQGSQGFTRRCLLAEVIRCRRSVAVIKLLIDHGAHLHAGPPESPSSYSALGYAALHAHADACQLLMGEYAQPVGKSELIAAIIGPSPKEGGDVDVFRLLFESEASMDPTLAGDEEKRAECLQCVLAEAIARGELDIAQVVLAPPAHWGPITPAVLGAGVRQVVSLAGRFQRQHYHYWEEEGFDHSQRVLQAIEVLSKAGADLDIDNGALLMAAIRSENKEVVARLLQAGVNANGQDGAPLREAASSCSCCYVVDLLLKHGARADACTGQMLYRLVVHERESYAARQLLSYGAAVGPYGPAMLKAAVETKDSMLARAVMEAGVLPDSVPGRGVCPAVLGFCSR